MLVYRITLKSFCHSLIAPGFEGRWNSAGRKVIYASESLPLAFMENMVRRQGIGFNDDYCSMIIDVPDSLEVYKEDIAELHPEWRNPNKYLFCQPFGNTWYDAGHTVILKVPSAVFPDACNYLINTTHPDYKQIKLVKSIPLVPDERIEDILKNYNPE